MVVLVIVREMGPRRFVQENRKVGEILFHLARYVSIRTANNLPIND